MDLIAESVEKQEKTASGNAELLQNLLINIQNLGDNVKNIQKEMGQWRDSEYLEAEANLERLHDEVAPFIPVSAGPSNGIPTPTGSLPVFLVAALNVSILVPSSIAVASSDDPSLSGLRDWVSALRKPYPGAPIVMTEGILARQNFGYADSVHPALNIGQAQAQAAINTSAQPVMGKSTA